MDAVMKLIEGVICLVFLSLFGYLVPWIKAHVSAEQLQVIQTIVNAAVYAAQQTMSGASGAQKKEEVCSQILDELAERGISINPQQLDNLIEAAVRTLKIKENRI